LQEGKHFFTTNSVLISILNVIVTCISLFFYVKRIIPKISMRHVCICLFGCCVDLCVPALVVRACTGGACLYWWCVPALVVRACTGGACLYWWCVPVLVVCACTGGA